MRNYWLAIIVVVSLSEEGAAQTARSHGAALTQTKATSSPQFSTAIPKSAPFVKRMSEVVLKDGDTYRLTARIVKQKLAGKVIKRLAYNGMIPGPALKLPQGAKIKIDFKNETDVETTIHSHGLRTDYRFDGVVGVGQQAVKPGQSFIYDLTFPDAGTFWYHPHVHEEYAQEMGLYGIYQVEPKTKDLYNKVSREVNLIVDDLLIENGKMPPFYRDFATHAAMGRFGNILLINDQPDFSFEAKQGEVVRFAVTNVANTRTFNFRIGGAKTKLVGGDAGLYEKDAFVDSVILSPSERAIIEVAFDKPGTFSFENNIPGHITKMGSIVVRASKDDGIATKEFASLKVRSELTEEFAPFRDLIKEKPHKRIVLSVNLTSPHAGHMKPGREPIEWDDDMPAMNADMTSNDVQWKMIDDETKKEDMSISWHFKRGDRVKIQVYNDPKSSHPMQHPIHFHGQHFVVLARDGIVNDNLVWKDTVLVKNGETVDIGLDASNPGKWMAHCHIAEHLSAGMMLSFDVAE